MKLNHIHIKVSNLEKAKEFYLFLGFKIREQVGNFLFLNFGEEHHSLALQEKKNVLPQEEESLGLYHFSIEVKNEKEFHFIIDKLKEKRIIFYPADHGISKAVYFSDPDNNGVEIMLDTRKSKDQLWKGKLYG
ncbi:VOC family protein [Candidatus Pacearchaeota archaeon]|nr:VOC family protein [Candidatus Pacearchaeota archaeon]